MSWPVVSLSEVVDFLDSKRRPVKESERVDGPYPYYGANGQQGWIDGFLFDEPLILLAEDGGHFDNPSRGIAYSIEGKTWVNNHAHVLRATPRVEHRYLLHSLKNRDVRQYITGSTRGKLTKEGASRIKIPLPPIEEQQRIAARLDQAEELRAKRRAAIALLDQLPQSIFLEMFGDPFSNPRSWTTKELRSVTSAIIDCPHSTPIWTSDGVTCLRTSNLGKGSWEWTDHRYVSEETYLLRSSRGEIDPGDIILSREGTVGIMAIAPEGHRMCMGQRLVQVKPRAEMVTAQFLMNYLLFLLSPERLKQSMVGSTAQHLNVKELRSLNCLVPTLALQHQFASKIQSIQCAKIAQKSALTELDSLFASLQATAFGGEL